MDMNDYLRLPVPQKYKVDQSSVNQYYQTLPPVYNYSHYSSIEKLYLKKAQTGSIIDERTPYMTQLTNKAPRGVKTDDHMFEYMKAEESDILLNMRMLHHASAEYKTLKAKLDYVQEIISTFMQKKNPNLNLDLAHYGEVPFMSNVDQLIKQEAREIYKKAPTEKFSSPQEQFNYIPNKLVVTDPYNPQDGFYLTFEFINWIPFSFEKIYIKYGFVKRNQAKYLAYRETKEFVAEQKPISNYNNTCFFGHQDFVKGIKPDRDEILYLEVWNTIRGEKPQTWHFFGWSVAELFDPMGVFTGGAYKSPLYDGMYERQLVSKIGLPYLTNGFIYMRVFLPIHFPQFYTVDTFAEHYIVQRIHMKNQDKSIIESVWKEKQIIEERLKEHLSKIQPQHSKHEGQVEEIERPSATPSRKKPGEHNLHAYNYDYSKQDQQQMINRITKQLNKYYLESIVNPHKIPDPAEQEEDTVGNDTSARPPSVRLSVYHGKSAFQTGFFAKSLEEQLSEILPASKIKQTNVDDDPFDGIFFKITKITNYDSGYYESIGIRGALIQDDNIIQDRRHRPCVVAREAPIRKLLKQTHSVDFSELFLTRNTDVLADISFHNYQNSILLFTIFDQQGRVIGWLYAPLLKLQNKQISLQSGRYRVRVCKPPVMTPPFDFKKVNYTDLVIEYMLLEGSEVVRTSDIPTMQNLQMPQEQEEPEMIAIGGNNNEVKPFNENSSISTMRLNNESTIMQSMQQQDETANLSIMEEILSKSIMENPAIMKPVSVYIDGIEWLEKGDPPLTFKVSLLKDSVICFDDQMKKVSYKGNEFKKGVGKTKRIDFAEEIMFDIDMKAFSTVNRMQLHKYFVVISLLDEHNILRYWHYAPLFKTNNMVLNIDDFQVQLYGPPFQVPTRVNQKLLTYTNVIIRYGIGFTQ